MQLIFSAICTFSAIWCASGQLENGQLEIRPEDCEWKFAMFVVFSETGCAGSYVGMRDSILSGAVLAKITLDKTPYCNSSIVNFTSNMALTGAFLPELSPGGPVSIQRQILPQYSSGGTGSIIVPKVVLTTGLGIQPAAIPQGCQICHIFGNYNFTWEDVLADLNKSIENPGSGREVYDTVLISAAGSVGVSLVTGVQCDMGEIVDAIEDRSYSRSVTMASAIVTLDNRFLSLKGIVSFSPLPISGTHYTTLPTNL